MQSGEDGWSNYRPSKTLWAWSIVGASALTMALGFTWGGWTTSGRARVTTDIAVRNAKADLVAGICVHNFVTAKDAQENLKALQAKSSWQRDDFIADGGWAKIAGIDDTITNAADACADQLVKMKELPQSGGDAAVTDS
ncbi:hypothetical protein [Rhizobium leguminosarum]|uniref:hypothetical protein n=1 Tax=Rhizobium leguminosarum TaxID=384 RepID=UPI001030349D|nr:hypothetical protein [Rhizobium leguminosarum]TAU88750.1 hypothetical protein ELI41_09340 [Rhizobium leguminosarum]TAV53400.1 hypothetical protein ELI29_10030 [Rhizobium leguminosarum]TAY17023.1 hypothetical protein ELH91_09695 [Rhizobium leguminosarum]